MRVCRNHGEYDVPKCAEGTPPAECVHTIVGHFQIKDTVKPCRDRADVWCAPTIGAYPQSTHVKLLHISPHCHGPACISMQMINADTNETICEVGQRRHLTCMPAQILMLLVIPPPPPFYLPLFRPSL